MERQVSITVLFCLLTICVVSGFPRIRPDTQKTVCMDMDTNCDAYRNKTYLCTNIGLGKSKCKKTCGLCTPSYDDAPVEVETSCTIKYANKNVVYPVGMHFTRQCESCTCDEGGYGCTDIHCGRFDLPDPACEWKPPVNPDRCCPVPSCPNGIEIKYPSYWAEH